MSHLRSNDFVPVELVLCSTMYDPSRWRGLESFNGNVAVQDIRVPSSRHILNQLCYRLYHVPNENNDKTFPIIPSKEVISILRAQFNDYHGSIISFLHQMKFAMAHHFSRKGTSMLGDHIWIFTIFTIKV